MTTDRHGFGSGGQWSGAGSKRCAGEVAQTSGLLYRGLPARRGLWRLPASKLGQRRFGWERRADWKSALRQTGSPRYGEGATPRPQRQAVGSQVNNLGYRKLPVCGAGGGHVQWAGWKAPGPTFALLLLVILGLSLCAPLGASPAVAGTNHVGVLPRTPTVAEARQMVIGFITRAATVKWVCKTTMDYSKEKAYTRELIYQPGVTYYGMPYVSHQNGVEFFGTFLDANRVYQGPIPFQDCPGSTCASSLKVAYRYVSSAVAFGGTPNILPHAGKGTVPVGDYQWQAATPAEQTLTRDIIRASTTNAILEAYALLQPADAIATRRPARGAINGHGRMVAAAPVVVRTVTGQIDPQASSLQVIEQTSTFEKKDDGFTTWRINKEYTFAALLAQGYVPLTVEEFKRGRMADARIKVTGLTLPESLGASRRLTGEVASNFFLSEVNAVVYDAAGRVVAQSQQYPEAKSCHLAQASFDHELTGLPAGTYRFVLAIKIGYGDYVAADYVFKKL